MVTLLAYYRHTVSRSITLLMMPDPVDTYTALIGATILASEIHLLYAAMSSNVQQCAPERVKFSLVDGAGDVRD